MAFEKITFEIDGDLALISFNDPATMNACGVDTADELLTALERAGNQARATILTGTGRGFCSGANLGSAGPRESKSDRETRQFDAGAALDAVYNPLIKAMHTHPHPLITAVNGAAAGVGCSIALMGDLVVCAESAYFLQAFGRIGLVPDGGSTYILPRLIGRARAAEMVLLADKVPAQQALDWGMVNRVVPDDQLMGEARSLAERLSQGPTRALELSRKLLRESADSTLDEMLQAERLAQRTAGRTKDFAEGVDAFLNKRKAVFTGE